jgi:hypothetical protein
MVKQRTFASMAWQAKGKVTRRERFLVEMDTVIPWALLIALIAAALPRGRTGAASRWGWRRCCASTSCTNGSICSDPQAEDARLYFFELDPGPFIRVIGK